MQTNKLSINIQQKRNKKEYDHYLVFNYSILEGKYLEFSIQNVIIFNRLSFEEHSETVLSKVNKAIGFMKTSKHPTKMSTAHHTRTFVRSYLDYGNIIYD